MTSKRTISATNETASLAQVVKPVFYTRLDFSTGVQRFHTEIGPRTVTHPTFGAELYTGIGDFGGLSSEVKESTTGTPHSVTLSLTGLKASLINLALTDDYFRRDAEIMLSLEDGNGVLLDDPIILFSGYMDKVDMTLGEGIANLSMVLESRGTNLLTASDWRFTDEDKQTEVSGDLAGEYIWMMIDLQLKWGEIPVYGGSPGSPTDTNLHQA